ncbi:hypothetical protein SAY87_018755 [Trapa incisa]|uniref:DUF936 domain-containing protein n=1 Tax=Trapa incisa TaxID=236973 RepID=A0AAN7K3C7_9MYRT|nr:hypothetical protein SAY87_018755 [Trapa incisa]
MAFLNSGVLIKLLEDINTDETAAASSDDRKPSLLQIRSIVPVLSDGNLWPNQGFYLKVSDASHAMHVSLPKEKDEFVLCNKLNIGQFVYVDRLEPAYPVPLLVGVRPFPGRNSCVSARKDLVSMENLVEISGTSDPETVEEVIKDMEEKSSRKVRTTSRMVRNMALECFRDRSDPSDSDGSRRVDRESTISTCSAMSRMMKRRSGNDSDSSRLDDTMETPTVTRRLKPIRHSTSTNISHQ